MFAIAQLTLSKMKEPSFLILLCFAIFLGYSMSEMDEMTKQFSGSLISYMLNSQATGTPVLTSSLIVFGMSVLLAIFIGATDIPRDIEQGAVMIFLTKPIRRIYYLLGKYLGILALCCSFYFLAELSLYLSHYIKTGEFYASSLILRQLFLVFAIIPLLSITVCISCFVPDFSAMILSCIYLLFSIFVGYIPLLLEMLPKSLGLSFYLYFMYYLFPNFIYYFQAIDLLSITSVTLIVYSIAISGLFLSIAALNLNARDLT